TTTHIGLDPTGNDMGALGDVFSEGQFDFSNVPPNPAPQFMLHGPKIKATSSWFDAGLRIFNNDFQQIGIDDNNPAVGGEDRLQLTGAIAPATFFREYYHRDPMLTFNVRRGEKYYVQVESAQRALLGTPDESKID